ncbi:exported hypothetical protein [Candidatus Sulfopaludibacter sp. SbA3]|nr:exported hypothetical protein [Candidatus Sulfopaludibacter sp. SbA3]
MTFLAAAVLAAAVFLPVLAHLAAIAFWAISFLRAGERLSALFFAIATAAGSFWFSILAIVYAFF